MSGHENRPESRPVGKPESRPEGRPESRHERTVSMIGQEAFDRLRDAKVLIFGVGGVGGYVCEALARAGVGHIAICDSDVVSESNLNRQIIATYDTIGLPKTDVMESRILSVNRECQVEKFDCFYLPGTPEAAAFDLAAYDYVVDAIDTVAAKIDIIVRCKEAGVPVISSMGTGNKLDPTRFEVVDIEKTSVCPLAKVIRKALRDRGIKGVKVLFSKEEPVKTGSRTPGSISFVPSAAGLIIGGEVIKDLIG